MLKFKKIKVDVLCYIKIKLYDFQSNIIIYIIKIAISLNKNKVFQVFIHIIFKILFCNSIELIKL